MRPKDVDRMANSVDPDQTAPQAVWSGSTLFAQTGLSENLGSLRVCWFMFRNLAYIEVSISFILFVQTDSKIPIRVRV